MKRQIPPYLKVVETPVQAQLDRTAFAVEQEILAYVEAKLAPLDLDRQKVIADAKRMAAERLRPIDRRWARLFTRALEEGALP